MVSYTLPQITCTPRWPALHTNFKRQTDHEEVAFPTTQSQKLRPQSFQPPPTPIRHTEAIKKIPHVERLPESTTKASFTPHHCCPVVKARTKHLVEGFPTIKGDRRCHSFVSHYNNTFQGAWRRADKPVETHCSVALGDPVKIVERETTHAASFSWPDACRPPVTKKHLKINLEHFSKNLWSSTSREDFCHHKPDNDTRCKESSCLNAKEVPKWEKNKYPVILIKRDENVSSLPKGDTDTRRNKERMSVTTNRISFSDLNHSEISVYAHGADLMTKSHVQFSPPRLSDLYYTTTAKEHYSKQHGQPARAAVQLSSNLLTRPEHKLNLSITKTDYLPLKTCRQTPCPSWQRSNIRFPLAHQHYSTTHREDYTTNP